MAQSEYLRLERPLRPKQPKQHRPDEVEQVPHRSFIARFGPSRQADGICDSDRRQLKIGIRGFTRLQADRPPVAYVNAVPCEQRYPAAWRATISTLAMA